MTTPSSYRGAVARAVLLAGLLGAACAAANARVEVDSAALRDVAEPADVGTVAASIHRSADTASGGAPLPNAAAGAGGNARSHLGGRTQLHVTERDGDADEAAALRAAGGEYTPDGDLACFPSYTRATYPRAKLAPRDPPKCGPEAAQEQHDLVYRRYGTRGSRFWVFHEGPDPVPGSFTVPGAKERLVFEPLAITVYDALGLTNHHLAFPQMVSLVDRNGVSRIVMVRDGSMQFRHLCRDPITGTDTAVFEKSYMGSCCPWDDTVYMHYDADAGTLTQAFVDRTAEPDELLDANGACRWRWSPPLEIRFAASTRFFKDHFEPGCVARHARASAVVSAAPAALSDKRLPEGEIS